MDSQRTTQDQNNQANYRAKPDGEIDPAGEAGWYLQREREKREMSLASAGGGCGIHPHHLEAIETGDLTSLPPRTEALRMVATYASFLGFDPQPLVLHYAQFLPQPVPLTKRVARPRPLGSAKVISFPGLAQAREFVSGAGGIVATVCGAVFLFGGVAWMVMPDGNPSQKPVAQKTAELVAPKPVEMAEAQPGVESGDRRIVSSISKIIEEPLPDATTARVDPGLANEADRSANGLSGLDALIEKNVNSAIPLPKPKPKRTVEKPVSEVPEPIAAAVPTRAVPASAPPPVSGQVKFEGTGRVFGAENRDARLVLKAKANIWIRIEDRDGNVVLTQTLLKGDAYRVPNRDGLIVIARDGGLLTYSVDGVDKGNLGNAGEILVGRPLDVATLNARG